MRNLVALKLTAVISITRHETAIQRSRSNAELLARLVLSITPRQMFAGNKMVPLFADQYAVKSENDEADK